MSKRKKIKSSLSEYFNFSARERRGSLFLACILIIQILVLYFLKNHENSFPPPDDKIISMLLDSQLVNTNIDSNSNSINPKSGNKISFHPFDPNHTDNESWAKLGLSEKQMIVINNYISHGGRFRVKKDFKKMYCISEDQYKKLEPFLVLPDTIMRDTPRRFFTQKEPVTVEIGNADSISLMELKGIGPVLASRIVRYREKLGGFYSKEQLKEVWGVSDSLYHSILPFVILKDDNPFRFVHLNTDSFEILASHPYIKSRLAGVICSYRKQHNTILNIDELKQIPLVTEENFLKLAPYIRP